MPSIFNLHIYGEHLCLVQIYAGGTYYVIDPRSASVTKAGLEAFFSSDVEKVWFECHSDETLVYKCYGLRIRNIYDIRVPAKLLGYDGNLLSLEESLLGIVPSFSKKKNQTANWLRRPIPPEQMEYALADVAHLLELKDVLERKIAEEGLEDECSRQMKAAMVMKPPVPGWKKLPGWKRFSRKEKAYAKWIFIARDKVAERFKGDLIVTENGIATDDDARRCEFIREAVDGLVQCIEDGIPLKGYMYWSLLDNFEWQKGFSMTFGLIAVDRATQTRHPKESLKVLGSLMEQ